MAIRILRRLAASKAGPPLRAARRTLKPELRRDHRDNQHLRLLLSFALPEDANCIDVGSHLGDVLEEMLRVAPLGRHIAYEPLPDLHAELVERFPTVDVRAAALSNEAGTATFTHVRTRPGYSGFRERPYPAAEETETITVRVESLDEALPDGYVPFLIKIDVEGAEQQVLEGAMTTLSTHRPTVVFEHGIAARSYGTKSTTVFDLFADAGLRIFDLEGDGPYSRGQFAEACERGRYWNFVAHA
ncbi:MAG: FkbM family methyltransferase [Actinobacteria bacterium]|nr:FkbM family methyltransferase [Actinomycetota bacterium]